MLKALYEVVSKTGANMGEASKTSICNVVDEDVDEKEGCESQLSKIRSEIANSPFVEPLLIGRARLFGTLVNYLSPEMTTKYIKYVAFEFYRLILWANFLC